MNNDGQVARTDAYTVKVRKTGETPAWQNVRSDGRISAIVRSGRTGTLTGAAAIVPELWPVCGSARRCRIVSGGPTRQVRNVHSAASEALHSSESGLATTVKNLSISAPTGLHTSAQSSL